MSSIRGYRAFPVAAHEEDTTTSFVVGVIVLLSAFYFIFRYVVPYAQNML